MWRWYWKLFHNRVLKCFQQWQHRCSKCITSQGEYFEGDPSQ
jgi:hypothetical protein